MGLTGSFLVFYPAIDRALHPAIAGVPGDARPTSYDAVYRALVRRFPDRSRAWQIEFPEQGGVIDARSLSADDEAGRSFAPLIAWVDPRTSEVLRGEQWGSFLATWIYDLHYTLLLGPGGAVVVGWLGVLVIVLLASGSWLWISRYRVPVRLGAGVTGQRPTRQRQLFDIHRTLGIIVAAFLIVLAATGAMISLPGLTRSLLSVVSPLRSTPTIPEGRPATTDRLSLDSAVAAARRRFPGAAVIWIHTPADDAGPYRLTLRQPFEPSPRFPHTEIWLDQHSGEELATRDPRDDRAGDIIVNWLHSLHNAEAFGAAGQALLVVIGFTPGALLGTGLWWWRTRTRAAVRARRRS